MSYQNWLITELILSGRWSWAVSRPRGDPGQAPSLSGRFLYTVISGCQQSALVQYTSCSVVLLSLNFPYLLWQVLSIFLFKMCDCSSYHHMRLNDRHPTTTESWLVMRPTHSNMLDESDLKMQQWKTRSPNSLYRNVLYHRIMWKIIKIKIKINHPHIFRIPKIRSSWVCVFDH